MGKRAKLLTPKMLGLVDDVVLSKAFANDRKCFKVVTQHVLGYYVSGDGRRAPVRIAPIYRADIYVRDGKARHILSSHEIGEYLNPQRSMDESPDRDGDAMAFIAMSTLAALENHSREEVYVRAEALKARKKARKRG